MPLVQGSSREAISKNIATEINAGKKPSQAAAIAYSVAGKDSDIPAAAGVMITDPEGRALFLRRAESGDHGGEWCWPGGGIEDSETPEDAARREVGEESGHELDGDLEPIDRSKGAVDFTTYAHRTPKRFAPLLNDEHTAFQWAHPSQAPQPLHPGVAATLQRLSPQEAKDCSTPAMDFALAFDRSARTIDLDGHLRVLGSVLSRAEVSPYLGSEVPQYDKLGLDPDRVYKLYRHPAELEKGISTFEGKPVLIRHKPAFATDHPRELTVGAVSNPRFKNGDVIGDMSIWDKDAIDAIQDGSQRHLSCGYHYTPVMQSGVTPDGQHYHGVMTNIKYNHLAIVNDPRVKGAMVADSALELRWLALDKLLNKLLSF